MIIEPIPSTNAPHFETRPVIEMNGECVSYADVGDYTEALHVLSESTNSPAFVTFWSVYLVDGLGQSEAIADRKTLYDANALALKLSHLRTVQTRDLTVTAATVWEAILEGDCENNELWEAWRNDVGAAALRGEVFNLTVWVEKVYSACRDIDDAGVCDVPFDWEFVPAALSFIKKNEKNYPDPDDYPDPKIVAPSVIAILCYYRLFHSA